MYGDVHSGILSRANLCNFDYLLQAEKIVFIVVLIVDQVFKFSDGTS